MMNMHCAEPELNDLAAGYAAGTLTEREVEAFELHLLECAACQAEVRLAAGVRAHVGDTGAGAFRRRRFTRWSYAVLPLAAAALVLLFLSRDRYDELARIEPASYQGVAVRAAEGPMLLVDSAMAAYTRGDYERAEADLQAASATIDEPGVNFFLGVTRLLLDRPRDAMAPLGRTIAATGNPYAAEARYYLAQAYLKLERGDSAIAQLDALANDESVLGRRARELLARVRQAER